MSLDKALATAQTEVPECVAAGYVDMVSGLLLGVKTVDSHPSEVLDLVAAATGDLFQGKNVSEIERLFEAQSSELDVDKRRRLVQDIDARLLADGARLPLMWNRAATCWQPHVRGYVPQTNSSFNGFRFEDVWLDRR